MLLCVELDPSYIADGAQWCSLSAYSYIFTQQKYRLSCLTLCSPMDHSLPGRLSMGFSRQEYLSGVPLPSPSLVSISVKMFLFCNIHFSFIFKIAF